ncbi:lipoprotein [Streptomyces nitrosporeus]|uniref:lipoprotein n=1 Tax=Streptomyces nitrosporeus TaxID=28894 RepID=UPI0039A3B6AA
MTRGTARGALRAVLAAGPAALALAGCSADGGGAGSKAPAERPAVDGGTGTKAPLAKGPRLGAAGSPCELPVTFDLAADWEPEAVDVDPGSDFTALAEQGTVALVCEIDAKPAGHIGYLRVWTGTPPGTGAGPDTDPKAVLEAFVADEPGAGEAAYTPVKAGSVAAAEVTYTVGGEARDEPGPRRAFALTTPEGPVVVHLGGPDPEEHRRMLPAYELAKKSLRLS